MIKRSFYSALHIKNYKEGEKVLLLAGRVQTNLTTNVAVYKTPDPTLAALKVEMDKLDASLKARNGDPQKTEACNNQSAVVYRMLKSLSAYVDKTASDDKATILLSGFDCNNEPEEHDIPAKAVIKRIEDGKTPCSAKLFMSAVLHADRYKVEISYTPSDANSWKTMLDPVSINKMELKNLTRAKDVSIRVTAGNTHGWGTPSEPVVFLPR